MSRMRETVTTVSTSRDHESNLDALLEDLQTTVSRSNSHLSLNGNVTGYRSIRRTTTDGTPEGTASEYHVEYLNPANSTQHMVESSYNSGNASGQRNQNKSYKYSAIESSSGSGAGGDIKMKKNISELDSLLDDLNSAQKKSFSETTVVSRNNSGIDSGLFEPATSTPHGQRTMEKHYREEKSFRGRSASPRRDLVFTGNRSRDPSPIQQQAYYEQHEQTPTVQQFYRYEKTTSTRTTAPTITDVIEPLSPSSNLRSLTYSEEPLAIKQRSPSPGGQTHSYQYYSNSTNSREIPPSPHISERVDRVTTYGRDIDNEYPPSRYPGGKSTSYNYSSSSTVRESRNEAPKTPPPHRSPSPVSFQQPPIPKPDPSHRLTYNVSPPQTVSSYKYSSTTTTTNQYPDSHSTMPRPFPTMPTSTTHDQQPPKQLDELLASLGETDTRTNRYTETNVHRYHSSSDHRSGGGIPSPVPAPPPAKEIYPSETTKMIEKEKVVEKSEDSKNLSGPPVYYPPGELFAKKEESMMMQQQSGGGMYKAKGKYEYEAKSKSKMKESSGKAVVPVCLPVCCAMPCSIM